MTEIRDSPRRQFLRTSALAGAAVGLGVPAGGASEGVTTATDDALPSPPSWTFRPMRWAQLTLVEDDPGKVDVAFWLDYFERTHSDAACLSAGGCVAYYPTEVPFHHRSAWLGDRDLFGELVAGCRRLGMVVVARTDPHATYDDVQAAHPDWIAVDADGKPRRHWASPEMWVTCGLGPYNFEFMTDVKREIMARYRVDGLFVNRWDGSGMCYCEHCRAGFHAATGRDLPRTTDPRDPAQNALSAVARGAALRPVAALGLRGPQDQPRLLRHPQHRRRRHQPARHEDDRRARADAGRRSPGPPRAHGALGHRHERQGVPGRHGLEARGRHLQRRGRGGLPLEGLRAERRRDPPLGRGSRRQRHAALVHEVRGHPARSTLAPSRRGDLHVVPRGRAIPAQRAAARPGGARLFPADGVVHRRRPRPGAGRGSCARAGTRRSSRPASPSRWSTTADSTPIT